MLKINLIRRSPILVLCEEGIFRADYFPFEVSGQGRMVFSEACPCVSIIPLAKGYREDLPCMRKYPQRNDSLISTCFIST
jgi:hypothetical protein